MRMETLRWNCEFLRCIRVIAILSTPDIWNSALTKNTWTLRRPRLRMQQFFRLSLYIVPILIRHSKYHLPLAKNNSDTTTLHMISLHTGSFAHKRYARSRWEYWALFEVCCAGITPHHLSADQHYQCSGTVPQFREWMNQLMCSESQRTWTTYFNTKKNNEEGHTQC